MKVWPEITRLELRFFTRSRTDDCCKRCGKTIAMLKDRVKKPEKEGMYNGLGNRESDPSRSTNHSAVKRRLLG